MLCASIVLVALIHICLKLKAINYGMGVRGKSRGRKRCVAPSVKWDGLKNKKVKRKVDRVIRNTGRRGGKREGGRGKKGGK